MTSETTAKIQKQYNAPDGKEFLEDIKKLHELCLKHSVGFSLVFEESASQWYTTIVSASPDERLVTKSRSLSAVLDIAIQHLENLS